MKVLLVSGSRADYGAIESVYAALRKYGVDAVLRTWFVDDTNLSEFDLAVIEGDRFEILRAAIELFLERIPIVHLGGGDLTEGSQDDSMRHAITKLASLHFTTCQDSAKRVIQMGEEAWRVKTVGEPGIDNLDIIDIGDAKRQAGIEKFSDNFFIIIWHPNTTVDAFQASVEAMTLTQALDQFDNDILIIGPNADAGRDAIKAHLQGWAMNRSKDTLNTIYRDNLPRSVFLTLLANCKALIGNSSSGYYEAPSFGTPVVDIGDRQKGRERSSNIVHCRLSYETIYLGIKDALKMKRTDTINPYFTGNAAERIASEISRIKDPKKLLLKRFYSIPH